jgi:hypothetical protein
MNAADPPGDPLPGGFFFLKTFPSPGFRRGPENHYPEWERACSNKTEAVVPMRK